MTGFFLTQCDSGTATGSSSSSGSSNLPDPTADVVSQVGSTNDVIVADSILFVNNLASGSDYDLESVITANVGTQKDPTTNFAVRPLNSADSNQHDVNTTVSYDESVDCGLGGTKRLQGDLTLVVGFNTGTGSLSGSYFVTYDNCDESVHLTTSTSPCDIETMINGTVTNTITLNFSDLNEFSPDQFELSDAVSASGMTFAINQGATRSVAFDYNIYDNSRYSSPEVSGSVTFASTSYDVIGMQDFIAATSDTQICP